MATLKIQTIHNNVIWLAGVARLETLVFVNAKEGEEAWEAFNRSINELRSENLQLRIRDSQCAYKNFDSAVNNGKLSPPNMIMVQVSFYFGEPENWLLVQGQNYLMEDGKTVDRI